ncbi:patatin-like phospholipase family protein [Actinomadura bangladeshensis]|uniref:Patatin-like phospholipase family protein n=1 Tax=Actinomadura bangladeshensis TaxID=453573 RepID=A0A6L9QY13_9ACTN|nr:patatin-like phospholipase family protein [Actinomadura bangladeshensis]NEA30038.1 patatin-like phospholipase family protein [Actinomadura bangladeshensis]
MSGNARALVLGGGGVAGIAWLTGVLAGLAGEGTDVTAADLLLGTSAGSAVAAQVGSGLPIGELFARQADPALQNRELVPSGGVTVAEFAEIWMRLAEEDSDPAAIRRGLGARALAADTVDESERRAVIEARLPVHEWPSRDLRVTAVNALTGDLRLFDRDSGVALVDAVAASCAVPMIWPPVTIGGIRYVDGGVRSVNNLDLAAGYERVLLIAPMDDPRLAVDIAAVEDEGGRVQVINPDEASQAAFGTDPLDPSTRTPSANAGLAQGKAAAAEVAPFWA